MDRKSITIEALTYIAQATSLLPPLLRQQLRFMNTIQEKIGKDVATDLHMEHLNRTVKTSYIGY